VNVKTVLINEQYAQLNTIAMRFSEVRSMLLDKSWMTKYLRAVLLAAVLHTHAPAQSFEPIEPTAETARALPVFIVTPTLPTGKALSLYPTVVELRAIIDAEGRLESYQLVGRAGDDEFIAAIKETIMLWRFRPVLNRLECAPVKSQAVMRLIFRLRNGVPEIGMSKVEAVAEEKSISLYEPGAPRVKRTLIKRPEVKYPLIAQRRRLDGVAVAAVKVDVDGNFSDPKIHYSSPIPAFGEALVEGVVSARMNTLDSSLQPDRNTKTCMQFLMAFCMGDSPELSTRACRARARQEASGNVNKSAITEGDIWEHGLIVDKATAEKHRLLGR
jgi:TonB family protein